MQSRQIQIIFNTPSSEVGIEKHIIKKVDDLIFENVYFVSFLEPKWGMEHPSNKSMTNR